MYFKPPQNNMTNPFYHPLNQQPVQEAVTVEMEFKTDADGAAAVGSETKSRGMLISGQKVRNKVYRLTFKNNNVMNQFMKTYDNKLNEGTEELEEGTPAYRAMMKKYKGSDTEKVFNMLRAKGYKVGEQDDTLVQNLLKRHRGNVKKVVDQIVKDYPGKFDVERMMMDHVEIKEGTWAIPDTPKKKRELKKLLQSPIKLGKVGGEASDKLYDLLGDDSLFDDLYDAGRENPNGDARLIIRQHMKRLGIKEEVEESVEQVDEMSAKQHYNKMVAQGKVGRGGRVVTPIDKKRFPNREREGLEGPFRNRKSGLVYYYDKKAGKYYDPLSDMYLEVSDVMENTASYDIDEYLAEEND